MKTLLGTLCAVLMSAATPAPAQDVQTVREQALAAVGSQDEQERRQAYSRLADVGLAGDLPMLYSALHDNDLTIRKIAEGAIWQVWGRSGDPEADRLYRSA